MLSMSGQWKKVVTKKKKKNQEKSGGERGHESEVHLEDRGAIL